MSFVQSYTIGCALFNVLILLAKIVILFIIKELMKDYFIFYACMTAGVESNCLRKTLSEHN